MERAVGDERARALIEAVVRRSYGKLIALLAARTRDVVLSEDALSQALLAALATWPEQGCPANPEGWLFTAARRRCIDLVRQRQQRERLASDAELALELLADSSAPSVLPDQRLGLLFACAHPAIDPGIRAPLMLQLVLGLDAARIGSAFLVSPAAMGQRLSRAKNKIRAAGIPLSIPEREELPGRLGAVLAAVYGAFAEGWSDAGTDVARRNLAEEALFLGRLVTELLPEDPEALGLLALMLHVEARRDARRSPAGDYVPLADQDPGRWSSALIAEAEELIRRASERGSIGRYQLEAALQSAHVARRRSAQADWSGIVLLYDALLELTGSPVVAINRALALAELRGAEVALAALDELAGEPRLAEYQPYWAARAELLARTGQVSAARDAYSIAIGLTPDDAVRRFLQARQAAPR